MERAICRVERIPLKEFFPSRGGRAGKMAKEACARCPVGPECNKYAERTGSIGIWNSNLRQLKTEKTNEAEDTLG